MDPGLVPARRPLRDRLHARWRKSIFNPYHFEGRLLRARIAEVAPRLKGRLLDVGCGERPYRALFPGVTRYVGIEHLAACVNVDQRLSQSVKHVVSLIDAFAEGEHLPFRDESFDCCAAFEVLEHVPDPTHVVEEMHRVVKPGGMLLVTVPFVIELHQTPYDYRRFTTFGIRRLLEDRGFRVEALLARGNLAMVAGKVLAHWIYRLGGKTVKRDGAIKLRPWAAPLVLSMAAVVQLVFRGISRFSGDEGLCLGYVALARRVDRAARADSAPLDR